MCFKQESPENVQLQTISAFTQQQEVISREIEDDDSSRDSGISMDEDHSAITDQPTSFTGLLSHDRDSSTVFSGIWKQNQPQDLNQFAQLSDSYLYESNNHDNYTKRASIKRRLSGTNGVTSRGKKARTIEESVKTAVHARKNVTNLVGDCSRPHRLPTTNGQQQDLHYITPATMVDIITGRISLGPDTQYKIIDCRYPYEYDGGHIPGALNLHTQEKLTDFIHTKHANPNVNESIIIFHCEFSLERGPKAAKFLRSMDRQLNADKYPLLNFPEIYVMKGGYKNFYDQQPEKCEPQFYIPMLHEDHRTDLKKFRRKSKSWSAGDKSSSLRSRSKLTKLRLEY